MKQFKFGEKRLIKFDIEGKVYQRPYNETLIRTIEEIEKNLNNAMKKIEDTTSFNEMFAEVEKECKKGIDLILGQGKFDEIFGVRGYDAMEEADLLMYLIDEINAFQSEIAEEQAKENKVVELSPEKKAQIEGAMKNAVSSEVGAIHELGIPRRTAEYR